jgi:hypothetical protein
MAIFSRHPMPMRSRAGAQGLPQIDMEGEKRKRENMHTKLWRGNERDRYEPMSEC